MAVIQEVVVPKINISSLKVAVRNLSTVVTIFFESTEFLHFTKKVTTIHSFMDIAFTLAYLALSEGGGMGAKFSEKGIVIK